MASSPERMMLPFDLVEEILSRIPLEYMIRLQLVCKQWYSLFKNKRFIDNYLDSTEARFIRIDNMVQIIDPVPQTCLNSPLPAGFPCKPFISAMIHCDGLVLLKFDNAELGRARLLIWNPILGQIKWIKPINFYGTDMFAEYGEGHNYFVLVGYNNDTYGIGYDNVSRDDHKILRFYNRVIEDLNKRYDDKIEIEIYDLKSNSWKFLEDTRYWSLVSSCKGGVSVIGNMYWVAQWRIDDQMFIQSFDFSTETFKPRSSLPFESHMLDAIALSSFKRNKLALLHQCVHTEKIEIWVTNKLDAEVMSWSKYLSVDKRIMPWLYAHQNLANPGFFIDKNGKIRVWYEKGIEKRENAGEDVSVSVHEISKDGFKKEVERSRFNLYGEYHTPFLSGYVYIPSLVPLPQ